MVVETGALGAPDLEGDLDKAIRKRENSVQVDGRYDFRTLARQLLGSPIHEVTARRLLLNMVPRNPLPSPLYRHLQRRYGSRL